jgi:hypothetical protein
MGEREREKEREKKRGGSGRGRGRERAREGEGEREATWRSTIRATPLCLWSLRTEGWGLRLRM